MKQYTKEQRDTIHKEAIGKKVTDLEWDDEDKYWVMTFDDNSEICFRFLSEILNK